MQQDICKETAEVAKRAGRAAKVKEASASRRCEREADARPTQALHADRADTSREPATPRAQPTVHSLHHPDLPSSSTYITVICELNLCASDCVRLFPTRVPTEIVRIFLVI
ncbi:unnamed protein product [Chrysodeixis includens]|uniref:Uncharacterized protein n=1 Tax=Chrysodeixis includens TaxID=689277 RepID=A0A9N8KT23_CHRIL|nr:unnamed protein product [Chrysodeixis includens]